MDSVVNGCKSAGTVTGEDTVGGIVGTASVPLSSPDPVSLTNESLAPGTVANCEAPAPSPACQPSAVLWATLKLAAV